MCEREQFAVGDRVILTRRSNCAQPTIGTSGTITDLYDAIRGPAAMVKWDQIGAGEFGFLTLLSCLDHYHQPKDGAYICVGDRVLYHNEDSDLSGRYGRVLAVFDSYSGRVAKVSFDTPFHGGLSFGGMCQPGHGNNVFVKHLIKIV